MPLAPLCGLQHGPLYCQCKGSSHHFFQKLNATRNFRALCLCVDIKICIWIFLGIIQTIALYKTIIANDFINGTDYRLSGQGDRPYSVKNHLYRATANAYARSFCRQLSVRPKNAWTVTKRKRVLLKLHLWPIWPNLWYRFAGRPRRGCWVPWSGKKKKKKTQQ